MLSSKCGKNHTCPRRASRIATGASAPSPEGHQSADLPGLEDSGATVAATGSVSVTDQAEVPRRSCPERVPVLQQHPVVNAEDVNDHALRAEFLPDNGLALGDVAFLGQSARRERRRERQDFAERLLNSVAALARVRVVLDVVVRNDRIQIIYVRPIADSFCTARLLTSIPRADMGSPFLCGLVCRYGRRSGTSEAQRTYYAYERAGREVMSAVSRLGAVRFGIILRWSAIADKQVWSIPHCAVVSLADRSYASAMSSACRREPPGAGCKTRASAWVLETSARGWFAGRLWNISQTMGGR